MESIKILNRFTTLPVLIDMIERRRLILLDPSKTWDDKNDTLIIEAYKEKSQISKLFALCFTYKAETIHHWKVFADGASGCCIEFDAKKLLKVFDENGSLIHGIIQYKKIKEDIPENFNIRDIPFIKRSPYTTENEYRVIWTGDTDNDTYEIEITLDLINRITFSQQMPSTIYESINKMLENQYIGIKGKINRSTIYENKTWIKKYSSL